MATPDDVRVVVDLTPDEVAFVQRPIKGSGGFQSLMSTLQAGVHGAALTLSPDGAERVMRYADQYRNGGYQQRLRPIAEKLRAAMEAMGGKHGS